ncbi:hypothetical protein ACE41H_19075 [Paenibacillus enshidis]|uniref:Uncharacterized protein n=1 Tax=Paenibacillus enshidis TaxID=1458439 RepID=A0ABV5AXC7_9BACL
MKDDLYKMIDAFDKLAEAGDGVIAIPPRTDNDRKELNRQMQDYLRGSKSDKLASQNR